MSKRRACTKELHLLVRLLERYSKGIGFKATVSYIIFFVVITILFAALKIEPTSIQKTVYSIGLTFFVISFWLFLVGWMWREKAR